MNVEDLCLDIREIIDEMDESRSRKKQKKLADDQETSNDNLI